MLERLAAALKKIGFDAVFDTSFAADLTIMEEALRAARPHAERRRAADVHQLLPGLGELRRDAPARPDPAPLHLQEPAADGRRADPRDLPAAADLAGKRLVVVSSCRARRRSSRRRTRATSTYVLTTRELEHLWGRLRRRVRAASPSSAPLDPPFAEATGAGRLFAGSGGVMEAAVRTAYLLVAGQELEGGPKVAEARGAEGVRRFTVTAGAGAVSTWPSSTASGGSRSPWTACSIPRPACTSSRS